MLVHFMQHGSTFCQKPGPPGKWQDGDRWDSDWATVTCPECLKAKEPMDTFVISEDGKSITCKRCKRKSYNLNDVANRYCDHCHQFHDDIWPPARHWWVTHPSHDDWISQVQALITDDNPRILTRKIVEIFSADSEYMDILAKAYWERRTPEQAFQLLQDHFGKNFTKSKHSQRA
jgi:hypothetical protein